MHHGPLSKHGKSSCSAADSSQTGLPSVPQTAIALISWEARLDLFWPAEWQPCGPWFVLNATLPPFREHLAHLLLNTHSLAPAKLPPLPNQVNAGWPWPQPEMLRQSESLSRLCEKKKACSLQTRTLLLLLRPLCRPDCGADPDHARTHAAPQRTRSRRHARGTLA